MAESVSGGFFFLVVAVLAALIAVFIKPVLAARKNARVAVDDSKLAVLIRNGVSAEALKPGVYSTWLTDDRIELYDAREQSMVIGGQEVLTSDMMAVRATLIARYKISDPIAYRLGALNVYGRIHEDVQIELRKRVAALSLDALMNDRGGLTNGFAEAVQTTMQGLGVMVIAVELRDVTLGGPAKQAFADIWKAQKEGQAALERARNEQASLRSLANAARMLKGNPELMNLRLLQALSGAPGKAPPTVVLGGRGGLVPVRSAAAEPDAPPDGN
ncbi:MAG: slipin family protein [Caulobacterales bacterium]